MRLNQFLAQATGLSRRKADEAIAAGHVRVNKRPAQVGQLVDPAKDTITYQGKPISLARPISILFYKPVGCVTTRHDPEGRRTIYDWLPEAYHALKPAGRLDKNSSGVLVLSNHGPLLQRLVHPRYEHDKHYRVTVSKKLTPEVLRAIEAGIPFEPEGKMAEQQVRQVVDETTVVLVLKTGFNRQIRRVFLALGYEVTALKRVMMAGFVLGKLKPGEHRILKPYEVNRFLDQPLARTGPAGGRAPMKPGQGKRQADAKPKRHAQLRGPKGPGSKPAPKR
jgi:23S rRNA pseudouridine2605 synthase